MTKQEIPFWIVATLIALAVIIVGAAIIYGRSLARAGRERKALHRRRVEDAEREAMFSPENRQKIYAVVEDEARRRGKSIHADDDTTRILPGMEP